MTAQDFSNTLEFARQLDAGDPLADYRSQFHFPQFEGRDTHYFCGNSLGLQPIATASYVKQELEDWARLGVEGHFHSKHPWFSYHKMFEGPLARLVGAHPDEVVAMNQLTVNLHLLMVTFFRPDRERFKIICEADAFPSDQYALETQLRHHKLDPDEALIEISPRAGEYSLRTEDIINAIEQHGPQLALVMLPGLQYYTGQAFDLPAITAAGHRAGAVVGFDLAHAAGNLELHLHDWDVDFAVWCSYKYLNSGPGGVSGAYVHRRHAANTALPRFAGWWGNEESERFQMKKGFRPAKTAAAWQLSNAPVLALAAHKASLDIFDAVGMPALAAKRDRLTAYLEFVLEDARRRSAAEEPLIITPRSPRERGAQLSMLMPRHGRRVFEELTAAGIVVDWREPDVIRAAPVPLYNSFEDVFHFGRVLGEVLRKHS